MEELRKFINLTEISRNVPGAIPQHYEINKISKKNKKIFEKHKKEILEKINALISDLRSNTKVFNRS